MERSRLTRLFRHLPCLENAHLRRVNSAFTACEQLQNSSCYTTSNKMGVSKKLIRHSHWSRRATKLACLARAAYRIAALLNENLK